MIHKKLDDAPQSYLLSVTDEVLAVLRHENMKDKHRKIDIEQIINKISEEYFSTLLNLAKELTDYTAEVEDKDDINQPGQIFDMEINPESSDESEGKFTMYDET